MDEQQINGGGAGAGGGAGGGAICSGTACHLPGF